MSILGKVSKPVVRPIRQFLDQYRYARSRLFVLNRFARESVGAEIGVWRGEFSSQILKTVHPNRFHLIDPWMYQSSPEFRHSLYGGATGRDQQHMDEIYRLLLEKFRKQINEGIIEVNRAPSEKVAAQFPDNYFDWIYVDGDHRYEGVLKDLVLYHPKVKRGGIIAGDDYTNSGQWWGDGVMRGVEEALRKGLYRDLTVNHNQFVIVKP